MSDADRVANHVVYERLGTGYHHARDTRAAHVFAQWPVGEGLLPMHVSHNGLSSAEILRFIGAANEARQRDG